MTLAPFPSLGCSTSASRLQCSLFSLRLKHVHVFTGHTLSFHRPIFRTWSSLLPWNSACMIDTLSPAGSETWSVCPFFWTRIFCSLNFLIVENEYFSLCDCVWIAIAQTLVQTNAIFYQHGRVHKKLQKVQKMTDISLFLPSFPKGK